MLREFDSGFPLYSYRGFLLSKCFFINLHILLCLYFVERICKFPTEKPRRSRVGMSNREMGEAMPGLTRPAVGYAASSSPTTSAHPPRLPTRLSTQALILSHSQSAERRRGRPLHYRSHPSLSSSLAHRSLASLPDPVPPSPDLSRLCALSIGPPHHHHRAGCADAKARPRRAAVWRLGHRPFQSSVSDLLHPQANVTDPPRVRAPRGTLRLRPCPSTAESTRCLSDLFPHR
jgi:hypothetical protein